MIPATPASRWSISGRRKVRFRIWFEIEAHALDAMAELGVVPKEAARAVWAKGVAGFDVARIDEIEAEVKHDVIAFLTCVAEHVGPEGALPPSGHDQFGRAGHLPRRAAEAGGGPADRRCRGRCSWC